MAIGYACLAIGVLDTSIARCILKNADEYKLREIIHQNLSALDRLIDYNCKNQIRLFRISSDLIPFGSHSVNQIKWWEEEKDILKAIGDKMNKAGIRGSMHPGQYTVLNAFHSEVITNAVHDLIYHDRVLSAMGLDQSSKLILHIGGVYGDKKEAMKSFIQNYNRLPQTVKDRLVIENDDKNYTIQDVLAISEMTGLPVVYDQLHHEINPPDSKLSVMEWMDLCKHTWKEKDGRQKIHYSQQKPGGVAGAHSETIVLESFLRFYQGLSDPEIDIMLEVKDKNLSAIKCINAIFHNAFAKELEEEWAKYHYYVKSKSARLDQEIRELLRKSRDPVCAEFYQRIEAAISLGEDREAEKDVARHIWKEISPDCTGKERNRYEKLMREYEIGQGSIRPVKHHLFKCAKERKLEDLTNSLYFYL